MMKSEVILGLVTEILVFSILGKIKRGLNKITIIDFWKVDFGFSGH